MTEEKKTAGETIKTMYRRIIRALKLDKSVYKEVVDDPEVTSQAILMPFLIEIAFIVIIAIAVTPLAIIYGATWKIGGTPIDIAAGIGIFILTSIVFVFGTFLIWVLSLFLIGRFAGVKDLQLKQVLRVEGFAFSPLFLSPFVLVATIYSAVLLVGLPEGTFDPSTFWVIPGIFLIGSILVLILLIISNIIAFREATDVTTGVSIMSNVFALILFGIIFTLIAVAFGLTIAQLAPLLFPPST